MTDQQFLGVNTAADKKEINNALIKKISHLDFEIDIEIIFNYIHCSQRLIEKTDNINVGEEIIITDEYREVIEDFNTEEGYDTPEELVRHFEILYDNPATRFNKLLWKSAIESLWGFEDEKLEDFLMPVADFLNAKPFLKSSVLFLIAENLPFRSFFAKEKNEENNEFWQQYGFVHHLLRVGNLQLDLHADVINTGQFSSPQLDDIYSRLLTSSNYYRDNFLPQAFIALQDEMSVDIKPLLIWQRELNILYKAVFVDKAEEASHLFQTTLQNALTAFPNDEQLLYIRAKFLFNVYTPEQFKEEIIATLKAIPNHVKCLFLLGKCYLKLGSPRAALIIFENLNKFNPLNMQYVTSAAIASRKYIDFCISEHDPKDNDKQYYLRMISTLIEKGMFDEVTVFADEAPKDDGDIKALLLYAKDAETYLVHGEKNKQQLIKALSLTKDKEIIRKIKTYYLNDMVYFSDIVLEKDFIFEYYKENPDDSTANYHLGIFYFADGNHEKAYDYLVKAKEIDPANIDNYYNLARVTSILGIHSEAIEYASAFLQYNKYNIIANEVYCDCAYSLRDYRAAHNNAKWILSICRDNEFDAKYFFYFTTSLSYQMDKFEAKDYNLGYINSMLELYDHYPKPDDFWINDNGSRSMYWAADICFKIGHYEKAAEYLECILINVKEYDWNLRENCLFMLLPQCLHALQKFEKLIQVLEVPTLELLQEKPYDPSAAVSCLHIAHAYFELGNNEAKMQWALTCANCYMKRNNPPIDWVAEYIVEHFLACLDLELHEQTIILGKAYLQFVKEIKDQHVWLTHNLANSYLALGKKEEALQYHRMCIEMGDEIYLECIEVNDSKEFLNAFN